MAGLVSGIADGLDGGLVVHKYEDLRIICTYLRCLTPKICHNWLVSNLKTIQFQLYYGKASNNEDEIEKMKLTHYSSSGACQNMN